VQSAGPLLAQHVHRACSFPGIHLQADTVSSRLPNLGRPTAMIDLAPSQTQSSHRRT